MSIHYHYTVPTSRLSLPAVLAATGAALIAAGLLLLSPRTLAASPDVLPGPDVQVYTGAITIVSDTQGRLVIVADVPPYDTADIVAIYQGPAPVSFPARTLRRATLLVESGRVRATCKKPEFFLDLGIAEDPGAVDVTGERLILRGGVALVTESVHRGTTVAAALAHAGSRPIVLEAENVSLAGQECTSGGPGSTACSYECTSASGGFTFSVSHGSKCSATCGPLSYACCSCSRWSKEASCSCIKELLGNVLPKCHAEVQ